MKNMASRVERTVPGDRRPPVMAGDRDYLHRCWMLLVDGDPPVDVMPLQDEYKLPVIMKDGRPHRFPGSKVMAKPADRQPSTA